MRKQVSPLLIGAVCAAAAFSACGDQVVLQAMKDNTLYQDFGGGTSNGAGNHFFAGVTGASSIRRGLLAFDIAGSIPAGSVIDNVTLQLHMSRTIVGNTNVRLRRVLADWGEGASHAGGQEGSGAPAQPGDATWLHTFYDTEFWNTQGGDFAGTISGVTTVGGIGFYQWTDPDMVVDVQGWLDAPATNFGWVVLGDESTFPTAKRFDSREHQTQANRPALIVDFTPPGEDATLLSWTRIIGQHFGGNLSSLVDSDDNYLGLNSDFGFQATEPHLWLIRVVGESDVSNPTDLSVRIESKADLPGAWAIVHLRNWRTNATDHIVTYDTTLADSVHVISGLDAGDYVRASDGRIEMTYRHVADNVISALGFNSRIDEINFNVN